MIEPYEITAHPGVITLFKNNVTWRRHRVIQVTSGFDTRKLDFPADQNRLRINGLQTDETCWLTIRNGDPLKRLLGRARHLEVVPRQCRLQAAITGSGACGLRAITSFLNGLVLDEGRPALARHRTLCEHLLPAIESGDQAFVADVLGGLTHDIEAADYLAVLPRTITADRILHLIRDGRQVVESGLQLGWYQNDLIWNRCRPAFEGDTFIRCCRFWAFSVNNLESINARVFRLEDLVASREAIDALLDYLGISATERPFFVSEWAETISRSPAWTPARNEVFSDICGDLMDKYYPGWRQT